MTRRDASDPATPDLDAFVEQLAAEPIDDIDTESLARLARAADVADPVPDGLVDRIQFAVALDEVWAEVAQIQTLSHDLAGVRSAATATTTQTMSFTSDDLTVVMTITPNGPDTVRVDGWVSTADPCVLVLRLPEAERRTEVRDGRFSFPSITRGMVQVRVESSRGGIVVTPTLQL